MFYSCFSYFSVMNLTKLQLICSLDVFQAPITEHILLRTTKFMVEMKANRKKKQSNRNSPAFSSENLRMDRSSLIYIQQQNVLVLLLCCALEIVHIPKSSLTFIALMSLVFWLSASLSCIFSLCGISCCPSSLPISLPASVDEVTAMSLPRSYGNVQQIKESAEPSFHVCLSCFCNDWDHVVKRQ